LEFENLTGIERTAYLLIAKVKEIRPCNLPSEKMIGAVSTLKNKGFVEIHKRYTSPSRRKKKKFVRIVSKFGVIETRGEGPVES
jgi:hypothetical protein